MDAQLKRWHAWQTRTIADATAVVGPTFSLKSSGFGWLHDMCSLPALQSAWSLLGAGVLQDAKRANWIKLPPVHSGLNAPVLKAGRLLWDTLSSKAHLVVGILQTAEESERTFVACLDCTRTVSCAEARAVPSAVFLVVGPTVHLLELRSCLRLHVGSASPVPWRTDVVLALESGLLVTESTDSE